MSAEDMNPKGGPPNMPVDAMPGTYPSDRLRAAGYVPLPRLWVTQEDMDVIMGMAKKHEGAVNAIRNEKAPTVSDGG